MKDVMSLVETWKGKEVTAFCSSMKFRGILEDVMEGGFLLLNNVAVISSVVEETSEYDNLILNVSEVNGIACEEFAERGGEAGEY